MKNHRPPILEEIDAFLAEVPMGESYFGKRAVGNSEIVARLRGGGRIWPETIDRLRAFMGERRGNIYSARELDKRLPRQNVPCRGRDSP